MPHKDAPTRLALKKEFTESKLKRNEDPDIWVTYLEDLQDKILKAKGNCADNRTFEANVTLTTFVCSLTSEYLSQVTVAEMRELRRAEREHVEPAERQAPNCSKIMKPLHRS